MDIELVEIRDFLALHHPFDLLPAEVIESLPEKMESSFARRGKTVIDHGQSCRTLYIVRTGAVETISPDGELLAHLSDGECFGIHAMLNNCTAVNKVVALEDSLFYMLPYEDFEELRKNYKQFAYFFAPLGASRLRDAQSHKSGGGDSQLNLLNTKANDLLTREAIAVSPTVSIQTAAQVMRDQRVSSLLIHEAGKLVGIMTDRDLRNRVVAGGLDINDPVSTIMTANPIALDAEKSAFDALLTMTEKNIRHLPITREGNVAGVITNTNLLQQQSTSAVYLVGDIYKQKTYEGMAKSVAKIPEVLLTMVDAGANSHSIGKITTSISDATTIRLLTLGEEKFGPPPVPYVWVASGSQARQEQTGVSDQDNFMIIDDAYDEAKHGEYFKALANYVCDGLNTTGYIYCPGEMMATTDKWRQPLSVWKKYFTKWIEEPEPKALMLSCVFFDLRAVRGDMDLYKELQSMIMEKAQKNSIFLSYMVGNALTHQPPLGFFRNFVLVSDGEHNNTLDLKHNGVVPIVDIARICALEGGVASVNTHERLQAEFHLDALSLEAAKDLLDAYEFLAITRLKHQANQIRRGQKPDNFVHPGNLSQFERSHMKDAFSVVKNIQASMARSHHVG